jgi:hypothetical protein
VARLTANSREGRQVAARERGEVGIGKKKMEIADLQIRLASLTRFSSVDVSAHPSLSLDINYFLLLPTQGRQHQDICPPNNRNVRRDHTTESGYNVYAEHCHCSIPRDTHTTCHIKRIYIQPASSCKKIQNYIVRAPRSFSPPLLVT